MASSSVLPFLLLLLLPQSFTTAQSPPQKISPDGSCAGSNGYTCKGSNFGDSCGRYNLCGRDYSYSKLSQGCQPAYGYCVPKGSVSPDGSCGGSDMFTCLGSTFGSSCSRNNQCGRDVGYSGAGCQPDFGFCQTCSVSAQPSTVIIRTTVTSTIQKLSTTATTSTVRSGVTTSLATTSTTATSVSTSVENRVVPSQLPPIFTTSVRLTTITIPLFTTQIVATT